MECLILILAILASYFLLEKWKPEWIQKVRNFIKKPINK